MTKLIPHWIFGKRAFGFSALALGSLGLGLAGAAQAQPEGERNTTMTRAQAQARAEAGFDRMDVNKDGKLDAADRAAQQGKHFDKMDANHDGSLSRDEFAAAHQGMGREKMGREKMGREKMGHMRGAMMAMPILRLADPAHTGSVTKAAFVGAALKLFDQADANHDGQVTPEERMAAMRAMRGNMHDKMPSRMRGASGEMPPPPQ
jgi:hypothetical protein